MKTGIIPRVVIVALLTLLASGHALAQLTVTSEISDVRMASDSNPTVFELRLSITAGSDLSGSTFSVNLGDASFTAISSSNNGACGSPNIATPAGGITANA
ncbi:MAG: hypothetical protein OIF35_11680, partial [Cellvibrionaceae bacterium]|nr:hypothetical protein [Cellvibrionaceae bacterium]